MFLNMKDEIEYYYCLKKTWAHPRKKIYWKIFLFDALMIRPSLLINIVLKEILLEALEYVWSHFK